MEKCKAVECDKSPAWKGGYCSRHAAQVRKHGRVTNTLPSYREPNRIIVDGDVAFIVLLNKGGHEVGRASFDVELIDIVVKFKWYMKSHGYVESKGNGGTMYLHRLVMDAPDQLSVDHIDRNPLNNVRSNLRACTQSQNLANRGAGRNSATGMKGVHPFKGGPKFAAQITHNRRVHHLGVFNTAEKAKAAYDEKARELFMEFAG